MLIMRGCLPFVHFFTGIQTPRPSLDNSMSGVLNGPFFKWHDSLWMISP